MEKEKLKELLNFQLQVKNSLTILRADIAQQNSTIKVVEEEKKSLKIENESLKSAKQYFQRQIDHLTKEVTSKEIEITRAENQSTIMVLEKLVNFISKFFEVQHLEDTVENRDQLLHQNEELTDRLKNTLVELTNLSELHEKIKEEKDLEIKVE